MGGDDAVFGTQQRIGAHDGLLADHIHGGAAELAAVQSVGHILLVDEAAPAVVQQDGSVLHFGDGLPADQLCRLREEGAVKAHHIGAAQQGVQIHIFRDLLPLCTAAAAGGENGHAQSLCDAAHGPTDAAKADDAHGLARQLHDGHFPVAEIGAAFPFARVDGLVVQLHMMADFQQQADGELGHHLGAVGGDVANRHTVFLRRLGVHHIVARGHHAQQLQTRAAFKDSPAHDGLVGQHDFGITDAADDLLGVRGALGIDGQLAQLLQRSPAQVAGIQGFAVQQYDLHRYSSCFFLSFYRNLTGFARAALAKTGHFPEFSL